jgi:4-amino-4-deoxy-L-arabinose transferase-like glycosyltransferase
MKLPRAKRAAPSSAPSVRPASSGRAKNILLGYPAVVVLLAVHWLLAFSSVYDKSPTFDEPVHLLGGYSYYLTDDYRLNAEAGVLPQRLAALPLWLGQVEFPTESRDIANLQQAQAAWTAGDQITLSYQFFYQSRNDPVRMLLWARGFMALVSVAMGVLVYFWSRRLFGAAGGMFSLAMFALSPAILANGPLAATDLTAALCFLLAIGCFWRMLHSLTLRRVLLSGAALGLLFLSKMSAPVILPMLLVLLVVRVKKGLPLELAVGQWKKRLGSRMEIGGALLGAVALNAVMVLVIIWTAYSWRYSAFAGPVGKDQFAYPAVLKKPGLAHDVGEFCNEHRLLPQAYVYGMVFTVQEADRRSAFLNGEHYLTGRRAFFPYAFAVKTPLSGLIVLALAVAAALRWRAGKEGSPPPQQVRDVLYRTTPLWTLMLGFWLVTVNSHINIGLRHLLPAYGPMLVLVGICGTWLESKARLLSWLAKGVLAAALLECVLAWPNYLAYFNVFAGGGDNAYKHLVDSSLDWGQDLPGLREWLLKNRSEHEPVYLSYFGSGSPTWYGLTLDDSAAKMKPAIPVRRLPGMFEMDMRRQGLDLWPLTGGTYCVSATMLQRIGDKAPGPWVDLYEQIYQEQAKQVRALLRKPPDQIRATMAENPKYWWPLANSFRSLRLGRLCAYLRQRKPDANINYSILIYHLSDDEVREALEGPAAELKEDWESPYTRPPD